MQLRVAVMKVARWRSRDLLHTSSSASPRPALSPSRVPLAVVKRRPHPKSPWSSGGDPSSCLKTFEA